MKCIKNKHGKISRVFDDKANTLVDTGDYKYCPKCEWKEQNKKKGNSKK